MIKFFRKIRYDLLGNPSNGQTGKTGKYLKYAIGEIILVVVGILIALQINNWSENRKQNFADIEFLQNLRSEIVLDTLSLSNRISFYHKINEDIENTIQLLDSAAILTESQIKFVSKTFEKTEILLPTYKNIDRNSLMLASGALNRLNQDLNNNYLIYLDNFKLSYDLSNKMTVSLNEAINNELYPFVDLNFTNQKKNHIEFNKAELKNNRSFFNSLQKSLWYRSTVLGTLKPLVSEAKSLIKQIDDVLE